ncbi:Alpha/Beta hydrolase protein [Crassisporium funariophilum]|nr:Alpha/Beta hydrolase protein [Crassisporium funariophilum]
MLETTGTVEFKVGSKSFKTWYKVVGDLKKSQRRPLVVLHGGPGLTHHYMIPHQILYLQANIPVVLYDQIGNGGSSHYRDAPEGFWSPDLFMDQLDNLLRHLDIEADFDLLGHSWGGFLAGLYAATRNPRGLRKLILANTPASIELLEASLNLHLDNFPEDFAAMIRKHEADNTMEEPEYQKGIGAFLAKHLCTLQPWPKELLQSFAENSKDPTVYNDMLGPYAFKIVGTLRPYSIIKNLHRVTAPTLVIHAPDDEVHEIAIRPFLEQISVVKWVELQKSTHLPMHEEPETYIEALIDFLV